MKKKGLTEDHIFAGAAYLLTGIMAVTCLYPMWHVVMASFSDPIELMRHSGVILKPLGHSLEGYRVVLQNPNIPKSYFNTIFYVLAGTSINMLLTTMGAYALSRKGFLFRRTLTLLIVFTMYFNAGLVPNFLLVKGLGMYNSILALLLPGAISTWNLIVMKTEYGMKLPFFVGRIYEDPMNISRSFIETTVLAGDYRMPGSQKIILFEEIGRDEPNMQYPVLEQAVYIQCLKQANREEALRALNNMIQEIEPLKSFVITQCLCFDIINVTIKTLDQMKGFELADVDFKKICTFTNLAEFREKAEVLVSEICRQYAQYKDNQNNTLKAGVLDYVNQHFGESGMGLEIVAGKFGVSANFMSRFFKQETGCSFIQYITMIRMDCAKELLINSDMQIKDIVAQIGYIDVANFVRKFKTYEGVTPGQYREKMRRQV